MTRLSLYRHLARPLLYQLPAEWAHELGFGLLRTVLGPRWVRHAVRNMLLPKGPELMVQALGCLFPTPIGIAAGFDKNAVGYDALHALGFGFVEVGTVTGQSQPGNARPRLFRLARDKALVNRLGFNNAGSVAVATRLRRPRSCVLGVNIGKTKVVSDSEAVQDYRLSARRLGPFADYLVVNVSSPNTPGLRSFQAVDKLRPILEGVKEELSALDQRVPLLVKIAPDLADEEIIAVADLALGLELAGIVATNTTVRRDNLRASPGHLDAIGAGGLSGAPLRERSREVLRLLASHTRGRLTLVSVGGVADADEAWTRIRLGASLIQLYTGFIYEGPFVARRIALGLRERAKKAGFPSVQAAVGTGLGDRESNAGA